MNVWQSGQRQVPGLMLRKRCGSPGCHCHDDPPVLHGPYQQWTRTEHGKTGTRLVPPEALERYRAWVEDERVLQETITPLHELATSIADGRPAANPAEACGKSVYAR